MANVKVNGKASKKKTRGTHTSIWYDVKYTGPEPVWDTARAEKMNDTEFYHHMRLSLNWYNYYYSQKDLKKHVITWMKTETKYTPKEIQAFQRASDKEMPITVYSLVTAHVNKGMPFRGRMLDYIHTNIKDAIFGAAPEVFAPAEDKSKKPEVKKPSIQDYIAEKIGPIIGELEGALDDAIKNKTPEIKPYDLLVSSNVPQAQISKFEAIFKGHLEEIAAAYKKKDPVLVEGYKHLKPLDFKRVISFLGQVLADLEQYRLVKKTTKKARVKKPMSKEKLIKRLKYAKENKLLKLVSINPADIIGSTEVYCYDAKKRKMIHYIASQYNQLSVKGTSIINFDENKSASKTLRKPDEQLKAFMKAGKVELRTFMTKIKAVSARPTGRMNNDILILKVV